MMPYLKDEPYSAVQGRAAPVVHFLGRGRGEPLSRPVVTLPTFDSIHLGVSLATSVRTSWQPVGHPVVPPSHGTLG